jgi:hypothetical protein
LHGGKVTLVLDEALSSCESQDAWHFMYQMTVCAIATEFQRTSLKTLTSYAFAVSSNASQGYKIGLNQTSHQFFGSSVGQCRMANFRVLVMQSTRT